MLQGTALAFEARPEAGASLASMSPAPISGRRGALREGLSGLLSLGGGPPPALVVGRRGGGGGGGDRGRGRGLRRFDLDQRRRYLQKITAMS